MRFKKFHSRIFQLLTSVLADLIEIFNTNGWHWAFYSFREDCWDNMDYELGQGKLSWQYWEAVENGKNLDEFRIDNPLFDVIKAHLRQSNPLRSKELL